MSEFSTPEAEYAYLQTTRAIRDRSEALYARAERDELAHFRLELGRLSYVTERVLQVARAAYPDLSRIPYHGRYRHFDVGGVPRLRLFSEQIAHLPPDEQLAARFELVISSVLLDAGAGMAWRYRGADGGVYSRSEGLAVASYELYVNGGLGGTPTDPRADVTGLAALSAASLARAFQANESNPLTGLPGRAGLLQRLAEVVQSSPAYFGSEAPRLGNLGIWLQRSASSERLQATAILSAVLDALGPVWQGRQRLAGKSLGDVWLHSQAGFVPFHKLSQWLSYSLFEPLESAGLVIEGADELTGLAEYRNGGLFLDSGVLELRDPDARLRAHPVDSDLIIEWRALTIALLDRTAQLVREHLGVSAAQLPLARILEGGTWSTGRALALEQRNDGSPPLLTVSDGTVF